MIQELFFEEKQKSNISSEEKMKSCRKLYFTKILYTLVDYKKKPQKTFLI